MPCPTSLTYALACRALVGAALLATGCGDTGALSRADPEVMTLGKAVYHRSASCVTCHQEGGLGVVKAFPPLRANPDLSVANPTDLIKIVSHGLVGETQALGVTYNAPMAGLGSRLTPEEIAAVLTYIRSSWRNTGGPVTVDQVLAVHQAYPGRVKPWTVEELQAAPLLDPEPHPEPQPEPPAVQTDASPAGPGPG